MAGGLGVEVVFAQVPLPGMNDPPLLFSESPTRFVLEVRPESRSGSGRSTCSTACRSA